MLELGFRYGYMGYSQVAKSLIGNIRIFFVASSERALQQAYLLGEKKICLKIWKISYLTSPYVEQIYYGFPLCVYSVT